MAESTGANTKSTPPQSNDGGAVGYGGFLETSKSDRIMWLMKCPTILSRALHNPPHDPQRPVAKVILSIDPLLPNDDHSFPECTMELTDPESGKIPKSYTMDMSKDFVPMSVFSESSQGKFSVEGKIKNKFDIRPSEDNFEKYGKLCRERTNKYMTRTRQVQVIDNTRGTHMRPMPGVIVSGFVERKKPPAKAPEVKRTRRDRGEMEEIMFKLFEKQPNWTLKQLIQETDQPEQFMKDLLRDLCVYNNKGANQGSYELKPEYKRSAEEPPPE